MTPNPLSFTPPTVPESTRHASTAFLPVSPVSALAKHDLVNTSQVRASTYCPRTLAEESDATRAVRRMREFTAFLEMGVREQARRINCSVKRDTSQAHSLVKRCRNEARFTRAQYIRRCAMPSQLITDLLAVLDKLSGGVHPGFRPAALRTA